jgi:hypothetical protein
MARQNNRRNHAGHLIEGIMAARSMAGSGRSRLPTMSRGKSACRQRSSAGSDEAWAAAEQACSAVDLAQDTAMRFWAAAWPFFLMPRWSASRRARN